jgi:hypothetical protein
MAALKVYSDDSGDDADSQHSFLAVAGYVSTPEKWIRFEREWLEVLEGYEVPWLHMKEWWNNNNEIYQHLKDDQKRQASFFADLTQCVKDNTIFAISSVLRLADFRKFNAETGLSLDAYSLFTPALLS